MSHFANGQDSSWPLPKCIDIALQNNIEIKIRQLEVKRAQKQHNSVLNQMLPSVDLTGNQNYNFGSTIDPATNGRVSSKIQNDNFFLNAQMNLIDFKAFATAQKTKIDIEKAKADKEVIENEYKLQLLDSYYQALFTQELVRIQTDQLKNAKFNLDRVTKEVSIGSKPKSDLYDMQLSFAQEEKRLLESQQLLLVQKTQLFQLMNYYEVVIADVVLENYFVENKIQAVSVSNSPQIKSAELAYKGSLKLINLERGNNLPRLTTYYSFSTFYYRPINGGAGSVDPFSQQLDDNKNHQFGLQLSLPVFNGFRNNKRIAASKIEAEKSKFSIAQEKQKVDNQVAIENQNKANYLQLQSKLSEMLQYAKASFTTTQAKFSSGQIDAVVFSSVKNQLLTTEYDVLKNSLQLQYVDLKINLIQNNQL